MTTDAMPMQPIEPDPEGVIRFKRNRIVAAVYERSRRDGYGLNEIHTGEFTDDERMQFAQLLGYSVSGYGTLQYVSDESYERAIAAAGAAPAPVAQQGTAPAWISVADRLPPDDDEDVLIWPKQGEGKCPDGFYSHKNGWYFYDDSGVPRQWRPCTPTHWMPLPAGPGEAP